MNIADFYFNKDLYMKTFFKKVALNEDPKSRKDELLRYLKCGFAEMYREYKKESLAHFIIYERVGRGHQQIKITDIIEYLLDTGVADISEFSFFGATMLQLALESGSFKHPDYNDYDTAIFKRNYDMELIRMLVARGINVRKCSKYQIISPLHIVAMHGLSPELAELLLSNGANIHDLDAGEGNTALHFASHPFSAYPDEMMKLLIKKGADINAVNKEGETPLKKIVRILRVRRRPFRKDMVRFKRCLRYCMQEISRLSFENRPICQANLDQINKNAQVRKYMAAGKAELDKMSATTFHAAFTYYFVYKHPLNVILARYEGNDELRDKFENNLSYPIYNDDLKERFEEAMELGRKIKRMEGTIDEIFPNLFPSVVLRRISEYVFVAEYRASLGYCEKLLCKKKIFGY